MSRRARRGMTLVEVVLAFAVFALLALFVGQVVRSVVGIWQSGAARGRGDLEFNAALELLRGDLRAFHAGPRGWLELDRYEAAPGTGADPPWLLPRLRFLARGSALPGALDGTLPGARGAGVELCWLLVPEDPVRSRLARLVRLAMPEEPGRSLREERVLAALLRAGAGLTVLDGVAWLQLEIVEQDGKRRPAGSYEPEQPYDFPAAIELVLERVAGGARALPVTLDADLGPAPQRLVLRGPAPLQQPEHALVEREWLRLAGSFPTPAAGERGARGSVPATHARGVRVWLPEAFRAACALAAGGRRLP